MRAALIALALWALITFGGLKLCREYFPLVTSVLIDPPPAGRTFGARR